MYGAIWQPRSYFILSGMESKKSSEASAYRVRRQIRLPKKLTQQHAICHVLDDGLVAGAVLKADGVADLMPKLDRHFSCNTRRHGHGSHSAGLRAADAAGF